MRDGINAPTTNSPTEVDAVAAPGIYVLALTAAECETLLGTLGGASSTPNVSIIPSTVSFSDAPTGAGIAAAVWGYASRVLSGWGPLVLHLPLPPVGDSLIQRYYGDSDPIVVTVRDSAGMLVHLDDAEVYLAITAGPKGTWENAIVQCSTGTEGGIDVTGEGELTIILTEEQILALPIESYWFTIKSEAGGGGRITRGHGPWRVMAATDFDL
jgi:hypothetical protein